MPYFLDGNNLIGRARRVSRPSEEDCMALVSEVTERLRQTRARAVLFFDGGRARASSLGNLTIRPCEKESADHAILREIERARSPREITVVTADRALARSARDRGAGALAPREFWSRVGASASSRESRGEQPVDVEEWMRYFQDEKNRR